jgi:hypothetical protein
MNLYPADWAVIAQAVKEANQYRCAACDRQCRRPGEFYLGWQYELTCAHITQDYAAPVVQLAALCLPCHLRHDARLVWVARRRKAGQLTLLHMDDMILHHGSI